jgi:hypothetical protein
VWLKSLENMDINLYNRINLDAEINVQVNDTTIEQIIQEKQGGYDNEQCSWK